MLLTGRPTWNNEVEETYEEFLAKKRKNSIEQIENLFGNIKGCSLKEEDKAALKLELKKLVKKL